MQRQDIIEIKKRKRESPWRPAGIEVGGAVGQEEEKKKNPREAAVFVAAEKMTRVYSLSETHGIYRSCYSTRVDLDRRIATDG